MLGPNIHIVSRKLIKPSNPTPRHLQSYKLSVFDQLAPSSHIKIILYFFTNEENKASNNCQRVSQMEESLSYTLSKFYPLAGRLEKKQEYVFIDCSDQGVEYFETKVDGELAELLHQGLDIESLDQLLPQDVGPADSATSPLVAIQTNIFSCGGLAIGVCVSHKVGDTSTVVAFINGWAKVNQAGSLYVPVLFYYLPSSEFNYTQNTERYDKLQKSLAETLEKFYPLAGRFRKDDFSIHCNDEGVEYVETKVDANLAEFLHEGPKIELLDDLLPWCVPPKADLESSPLLGVQVNIFNCGGLVIGIQISHILADAFTLARFVNEWAHISQTGRTKGCLPSFDHLSSLFPAKVPSAPQLSLASNGVSKLVTRRFLFDALAIEKLKDRFDSSGMFTKPTRVVVVMSLLWKVLMGISSAKHGHSRDSSLLFAINLRGKSKLPYSEQALGNFCTSGISTLEANQSRKELKDFVILVRNTIRDISVGIGKASIDDVTFMSVNGNKDAVNKLGKKDQMDICLSSSWCKLPWYEADFGWGKPFWVSIVSKATEVITLIDTRTGDGIEVWIGLKENDMAEFERHPDILTLCPPLQN